ncbi:MAG: glycosyltransferase family 39 protein [Halobacteriovoraceae bacterium]|nr:glycosyltransferase family 39 protein [Halobacteriovoraceae bacterium]
MNFIRANYLFIWPSLLFTVLVFNQSWVPGMFHDGTLYSALGKNAALYGHWLVPKMSDTYYSQFFEHPPLISISLGILFKIFGVSWTTSRLFNLFFGLASLFMIWKYCLRFHNSRVAQFAIVLFTMCFPIIRICRFPNMDMAIVLFSIICFYFYKLSVETGKVHFIPLGISFGIALSFKGHASFFIPLIICIDYASSNQFSYKKTLLYFCGFLLGLLIFSIWPISLYLTNNFHGFNYWFERQFISTVVKGRDNEESNFFGYILILLRGSIFLVIPTIYLFRNKFNLKKYRFLLVWILGILIPYSFMKFKLGHYIAPIYPALCISSAIVIIESFEFAPYRFNQFLKYITAIISIILLCFPLTSRIRRDKDLIKILDYINTEKFMQKNLILNEGSYALWNFANLVSFMTEKNPVVKKIDENEKGLVISKEKSLFNHRPIYSFNSLKLFLLE